MKRNFGVNYSLTMMAPGIAVYIVFFVVPLLVGAFYSFTYWDFFSWSFCGLENYKNILTNADLSISIQNTFIFSSVTTVFKVGLGLALAVFLNRKLKMANLLRTVYFLPAVLNNVAVGLLFAAILHPETGVLNRFFRLFGLDFLAAEWLTDTRLAIFSVSGVEIWKYTGFTMVILLAGLQTVSKEYYEAATIDGANSWQRFMYVTFPLIMPAFNNAVVLNLIGGLKIFDIVIATTGGGPGNATEVLNTMIYRSFGNGRYGEASAGNIILGILVAVVSITVYMTIRKKEVELG